MKLVHRPLTGGLLHLVQRCRPPRLLLVTVHPLTASVPITVLLYNGPLLCGFNVPVKGLTIAASDVINDVDDDGRTHYIVCIISHFAISACIHK